MATARSDLTIRLDPRNIWRVGYVLMAVVAVALSYRKRFDLRPDLDDVVMADERRPGRPAGAEPQLEGDPA